MEEYQTVPSASSHNAFDQVPGLPRPGKAAGLDSQQHAAKDDKRQDRRWHTSAPSRHPTWPGRKLPLVWSRADFHSPSLGVQLLGRTTSASSP